MLKRVRFSSVAGEGSEGVEMTLIEKLRAIQTKAPPCKDHGDCKLDPCIYRLAIEAIREINSINGGSILAVEYGFKAAERGLNLDAAIEEFKKVMR